MRDIKTHPLILSALVSLSLHGLLAVLLIPSVLKVFPEEKLAFEVAWLMPSPPSQLQSSPSHPRFPLCHPRPREGGEHGDPEESLKKNNTLALSKTPSPLKKARFTPPVFLDPRLRGDDTRVRRSLTGPKFSRSQNDARVKATHPHQPLPSYPWVCRKRRQEGIVCLHVKTNKEGYVVEAHLHKSSGHALLDKAALEAVKAWTFKERNFQKTLSIAFRLKEEKVSFS